MKPGFLFRRMMTGGAIQIVRRSSSPSGWHALEADEVRRVESRIGQPEVLEALHELGRAGQQNERHGSLSDDQGPPQTPAMPGAGRGRLLLLSCSEVSTRELNGRQQTEDECRGDGNGEREGKHPWIDVR